MNRNPPAYENYFISYHDALNIRDKAVKGAGATIYSQLAIQGITTVGTIILARMLTPEDFGLVTMVMVFVLLLQNFGSSGLTEALIQNRELNHRQASTLFWLQIASSILLMILLMAASPFIAFFYKTPQLKFITIILSISIFSSGASAIHLGIMQRNMQFHKTAIINLLGISIGTVVAIGLAAMGAAYWSIVIRRVTELFVICIGAWGACGWRPGIPSRERKALNMYKFGLRVYANFMLNYFTRNIDKMLIGRFHGAHQLGSYDRAYHLSSRPVSQLTHPLANVGIASLSKFIDDPATYQRYFSKVIFLLAFIGMWASSVLCVAGYYLIILLLGSEWKEAGKVFLGFSPGIGIIMIYYTNVWLHLSLGRPGRLVKWNIFSLFLVFAAYVAGLPFGAFGVAVAYSISFYLLLIPALCYAGKPMNLKPIFFFSPLWRFILSFFVVVSLSWLIFFQYEPINNILREFNILIKVIILSFLSTSLYLFTVIALHQGVKPINQFLNILKEITPQFRKRQ
ncbi:MAG: lipopolysaccharide biosynthesis protein [Chitinispirillaceae bacterium]|nr:lipopolysaccharide biosynthesis protein [Chitinispirillaceae bacterium]